MKVKNINGTSENTCKCNSWLAHWEKFSGEKANTCVEASCMEKATLGAHVQKSTSTDSHWYIVPFCSSHNSQKGQELSLYNAPTLISANVSKTCGK